MHFTKSFILFILLIFVMFGCKNNDSSTNTPTQSDFVPLPLKIGNKWIYDVTTTTRTYFDTTTVVQTVDTLGHQAFLLSNDHLIFDIDICYYQDGNLDGVFDNYNGVTHNMTQVVIFPKNPIVGQEWSWGGETYNVSSQSETISTIAGNFSCYKISVTNNNQSIGTLWWSNNVGIIKIVSSEGTYQLSSYFLK